MYQVIGVLWSKERETDSEERREYALVQAKKRVLGSGGIIFRARVQITSAPRPDILFKKYLESLTVSTGGKAASSLSSLPKGKYDCKVSTSSTFNCRSDSEK